MHKALKWRPLVIRAVFFCLTVTILTQCKAPEKPAVVLGLDDYRESHEENFQNALLLAEEVQELLKKNHFRNPGFATAIVFPELMRYSQLRDRIETAATSMLYSSGTSFLNCSIGYCQMKPLFLVDIEKRIAASPELKLKYSVIDFGGMSDNFEVRRARVQRARDISSQIFYLEAFIDIAMEKYDLSGKDQLYCLKILSTLYNLGVGYSLESMEEISNLPSFPNGLGHSRSRWSYSRIALDYYQNIYNKSTENRDKGIQLSE